MLISKFLIKELGHNYVKKNPFSQERKLAFYNDND